MKKSNIKNGKMTLLFIDTYKMNGDVKLATSGRPNFNRYNGNIFKNHKNIYII